MPLTADDVEPPADEAEAVPDAPPLVPELSTLPQSDIRADLKDYELTVTNTLLDSLRPSLSSTP